jgi:hypothetical protein
LPCSRQFPIAIARRASIASGSLTSQSTAQSRAARQTAPARLADAPAVHHEAIAALPPGWLDSSTVPAPSMPATIGHWRTTGLRFVMARAVLVVGGRVLDLHEDVAVREASSRRHRAPGAKPCVIFSSIKALNMSGSSFD